ncbi:MAG: nucleotidyltransferase domain-containing protein [Candidatus Cloacimonetes bacterium]|nr:nucleotidyltransferase domain-containing protein [Candidatus Cloacimonadota bacterium]
MLLTKDPRFIRIFKAMEPYIDEFGINRILVFGSYAKGTEKKGSDIDVIIDVNKSTSIYQFIGLKQDISKALNNKIDLFKTSNLEPIIKDKIMQEAIKIYEQR